MQCGRRGLLMVLNTTLREIQYFWEKLTHLNTVTLSIQGSWQKHWNSTNTVFILSNMWKNEVHLELKLMLKAHTRLKGAF